MHINSYIRKPFTIEAVQVATSNMYDIANWCGGHLDAGTIKVPVKRPLSPKQTIANVGDWVLKSDSGFKVYTDEAFKRNFDLIEDVNLTMTDLMEGMAWVLKQVRGSI
jgi:hypothetical protein